MVFKVSKGGVRTGNTLRGLNSTATKRYGRHACLLGYTSLGRRDLSRLVRDEPEDSQMVSETLAKTDVLLSLNKQQRWRLPAMIGHMIKAGDFNKGAVVSLLEKHKLKRKANCVNLVSNSKRTSCIKPKNNKYFSFSLDTAVADSQSRRERRRVRVQELKKLKIIPTSASLANKENRRNNVIEAFTVDGAIPAMLPTTKSLFDSDRPEYRMEVFYPCPRSCSLTYNPKYTDVMVAEGKTGELEVKSNVKIQKKGVATHRKRLLARDVERLYCDEIDDDVNAMWDECREEENLEGDVSDDLATYYRHSEMLSIEYTMDALLAQAKKTRDLCVVKKFCDNEMKPYRGSKAVSLSEHEKSHIVYVENESKKYSDAKETQRTDKDSRSDTDITPIKADDSISTSNDLEYVRVILSTVETDPEELRRNYGTLFAESSCQPRRFVLDITDDVTNLLATSKSITMARDFSSYIVFVYDGFYDNGLPAYKVSFNSMVGANMAGLSEILPFSETSITHIVNGLACHLLDLKEKNNLEFVQTNGERGTKSNAEFLKSRMKLKVETFYPSNETSNKSISSVTGDKKESSVNASEVCTAMEDDVFCDVCYVSVTSSRIDSMSGTKLKSCGHILCDDCWRSHFRTGISAGKTIMACGGYDCRTEVGPVTLMSILNVSEVALLLKRQAEEKFETMENVKWCPNPDCGRVIKVDSKSQDLCVDIQCACGNKLCFSCMGPSHWPATCDQAEEYLEKLPALTPAKEFVEEKQSTPVCLVNKKTKKPEVVKVEGRLCPRCKNFIEKNGGCPSMVCRCGFHMCWSCMRPFHYYGKCEPDSSFVYKLTLTLVVKHAVAKELVSPDSQAEPEKPKMVKNKQKVTLYQRALKQREEIAATAKYGSRYIAPLVNKIVKESQRDPQFKQEMMKLFLDVTRKTNIDDASLSRFNTPSHVTKFVRTTVEMKGELHHVREYTYILLQGTPHSVAKQRILKLVDDLNGFCSIVTSILDLQGNQDAALAFRRLVELRRWAERALDALIKTTKSLRMV